ncbi:hypothetical protein ACTXJY_00160 [Corynebacterium casei]|uniref:hypothetical protein n=1 Tax=Corynebacterium casei TaxID=160386 RepID=UPI003FD5755E
MEPIFIAILSGVVTGFAPNIALLFGTVNRDKRDAELQRIADEFGEKDLSKRLKTRRENRIKAHAERKTYPWWSGLLTAIAVGLGVLAIALTSMTKLTGDVGTTRDYDFFALLAATAAILFISSAVAVTIRNEFWTSPKEKDETAPNACVHCQAEETPQEPA